MVLRGENISRMHFCLSDQWGSFSMVEESGWEALREQKVWKDQHFSSRVRSSPDYCSHDSSHDYCFSLVVLFIILLLQLSPCYHPRFHSTFQTACKEKGNEANKYDFPNFAFGHDSEF